MRVRMMTGFFTVRRKEIYSTKKKNEMLSTYKHMYKWKIRRTVFNTVRFNTGSTRLYVTAT